MDQLHEEKEPIEWRSLHVGAEREVNCEHMQASLTKKTAATLGVARGSPDQSGTRILQMQHGVHGELGREDGVRRGQAVSGIEGSLTGVHGHVVAALLAEMQDGSRIGLLRKL